MASDDDTSSGTQQIERTAALRLLVSDRPWPFAATHREDIAAHWAVRQRANPAFFDGQIFVLRALRQTPHALEATFSLERFSAFLYWRDGRGRDDGTLDGFASALVRSTEGHVLVGCASEGTLNAGRYYLPGGFLDARDQRPDGTIDVEASAARELQEETGLTPPDVAPFPGVIVARHGRNCCFATEYRSRLSSAELVQLMQQAPNRDRELSDIAIIRTPEDLARLDVLDHARFLIANVLAGTV